MLKEALEFLAQQNTKTLRASYEYFDKLDRVVVCGADGSVEYFPVRSGPRKHVAGCLDAFMKALSAIETRYDFADEVNVIDGVWISFEEVVGVLRSEEDRRSTVTLPLRFSARFRELLALTGDAPRGYDQRAIIHWLRVTMRGAGLESFIPAFRKLQFVQRQNAGGTIKHGDESLGRSIEASIVEAVDVPEVMVASVPVFDCPDASNVAEVEILVTLDLTQQRITLAVNLDQIQFQIFRALEIIRDYLVLGLGESSPIFIGKP